MLKFHLIEYRTLCLPARGCGWQNRIPQRNIGPCRFGQRGVRHLPMIILAGTAAATAPGARASMPARERPASRRTRAIGDSGSRAQPSILLSLDPCIFFRSLSGICELIKNFENIHPNRNDKFRPLLYIIVNKPDFIKRDLSRGGQRKTISG